MIGPLLKLSIVATALGMALVLLSITSGKGLQHAIMDKFSALEGDFTISAYAPNRTEELNPIRLTDSLAGALREAPYVRSVYPVVQKMALLVNPIEDAFDGIQIKGMETDYLKTFSAQYGTSGQCLHSYLALRCLTIHYSRTRIGPRHWRYRCIDRTEESRRIAAPPKIHCGRAVYHGLRRI